MKGIKNDKSKRTERNSILWKKGKIVGTVGLIEQMKRDGVVLIVDEHMNIIKKESL